MLMMMMIVMSCTYTRAKESIAIRFAGVSFVCLSRETLF